VDATSVVAYWCHPKEVHVYATPERTVEQRREALAHANEIRVKRADWKRRVKAGWVAPLPALQAPPPELQGMKAFDWLLAVPKVGRVKATRLLGKAGVSHSKTLGGLSERQRRELAWLIAEKRS
jgi:hypothetical protein